MKRRSRRGIGVVYSPHPASAIGVKYSPHPVSPAMRGHRKKLHGAGSLGNYPRPTGVPRVKPRPTGPVLRRKRR